MKLTSLRFPLGVVSLPINITLIYFIVTAVGHNFSASAISKPNTGMVDAMSLSVSQFQETKQNDGSDNRNK